MTPRSDAGPPSTVSPILLDPTAVGKVLAISRDQVFKLMRSGELPHVRIGRFYRVPLAAVESFVSSRTRCRAAPEPALRVRTRAHRIVALDDKDAPDALRQRA